MTAPLPVLETPEPAPPPAPPRGVLFWNVLALVAALVAVAGSLWLSLGMQLRACPLCFYQRCFVMGTAAVLLMALLTDSRSSASVSLMALPMAVGGLCVAGFHVYLEVTHKLECPQGVFGIGTGPQQSLAAHLVLCLFLAIAGFRRPASAVAVLLGGLLALGCVVSTPKMPGPPAQPYAEGTLDTCRPPYRAP